MAHLYTRAEDRYILLNYLTMTPTELAESLGRTLPGIQRKMVYLGICKSKYYLRKKGHRVPLTDKAKAYELYVSGLRLYEIAKEMSYPRQSIAGWIRDFKGYQGENKGYITRQSQL